MNKRLTILVDHDDVLNDFCKVWVDTLNKLFDVHVDYEDIKEWDMQKAFPMLSKQEIYWPLSREWMWERVNPLPGAADTIKKLIKDGHKIVVVTASAPDTIEPKLKRFLFRHYPFLTINDVVIAEQKNLIKGDVMIDDGIHNFNGVSCHKLLMTTPANRNFDAAQNGMQRVNNWDEIYRIICEISTDEYEKGVKMAKVILFSTDCPKCKVLKKKLDSAGIEYTENKDVDLMLDLGITQAPMLKVDDALMDFGRAMEWVRR